MGSETSAYLTHSFDQGTWLLRTGQLTQSVAEAFRPEVWKNREQSTHFCAACAMGRATSARGVCRVHPWMLLRYLCVLGGGKDVIKLLFESLPI